MPIRDHKGIYSKIIFRFVSIRFLIKRKDSKIVYFSFQILLYLCKVLRKKSKMNSVNDDITEFHVRDATNNIWHSVNQKRPDIFQARLLVSQNVIEWTKEGLFWLFL